jgi:hypothetical protein
MMNTTIALAAAVAAFSLAAPAVAGAPELSLEPAANGAAVRYHLAFDGHFWNGQKRAYDHQIALTRTAPGSFSASVDKREDSQHLDLTATRNADATLLSSNPDERFAAYNTVARIVAAAGPNLAPGAAWDAKIPVAVTESTTSDVPVHVTVASVDGERTVVQATGTSTTSMTYSGFTVPVDVTVRLASLFVGGKFARMDLAASEVVHAGPQTQTMGWTFGFERI